MSDILSPDTIEQALVAAGVPPSKARARARLECSETVAPAPDDTARLEKAIELAGDRQLVALGFAVVKFSHPGKTKQTPGIPDRRYYHTGRRLAFWWEAKSATGRQRPDQKLFQEMCDAVGDPYCLGTDRDLFDWLLVHYPLVRDEQGHLTWRDA